MAEGGVFGSMNVSVVSPSGALYEGTVSSLKVPGHDGSMGIMPGHAPLLGLLGQGLLTCYPLDGRVERFIIDGGFLEIGIGKVTILANKAEKLSEVNVDEARNELIELQGKKVIGDDAIDEHLQRMQAARVRIRYKTGGETPAS